MLKCVYLQSINVQWKAFAVGTESASETTSPAQPCASAVWSSQAPAVSRRSVRTSWSARMEVDAAGMYAAATTPSLGLRAT